MTNTNTNTDKTPTTSEINRAKRIAELGPAIGMVLDDCLGLVRVAGDLGLSMMDLGRMAFDHAERFREMDPAIQTAIREDFLQGVALGARTGLTSFVAVTEAAAVRKPYVDLERPIATVMESHGMEDPRGPVEKLLDRLFAEAPRLNDTDEPAFECTVVLPHVGQPLSGVLSRTPEGCLRMMSPAQFGKEVMLVEQFFHPADVIAVITKHQVRKEDDSLIIGS